jgi:Neurotransmitter-gated ion-channel ligand binding domain
MSESYLSTASCRCDRDLFLVRYPHAVRGLCVWSLYLCGLSVRVYSADVRLKEQRDAMVILSYNGSVLWIPPAIFKSTCGIDITNFPYDVQKCKLKFGSWTYDGFKLDIQFIENASIDIGDYVESNEWMLIGSPAKRNVVHYSGLSAPYLVLPCVLLSFLTLVIFWLPPESPAKVMLGESSTLRAAVELTTSPGRR